MKAGAHAFLGWLASGTQEMFDLAYEKPVIEKKAPTPTPKKG